MTRPTWHRRRAMTARGLMALLLLLAGHAPGATIPAAKDGPALDPKRLEELWDDLGAEKMDTAHKAAATLVTSDRGVDLLTGKLKGLLAGLEPGRFKQLIAGLDHAEHAVRESASKELAALGPLAAPALRKALEGAESPEARIRIKALLDGCADSFSSPTARRLARIPMALELAGTKQAQALLERLDAAAPRPPAPPIGPGKLRPLEGPQRDAAYAGADRADLLLAEYEKAAGREPPQINAAFILAGLASMETIARHPGTELDDYCRARLSGLYQFAGQRDRSMRELEEIARVFAGTPKEGGAHLTVAYEYLQTIQNPAMAIPVFEKVLAIADRPGPPHADRAEELNWTAERDNLRASAQGGLQRCRKELADRAEADKTPWAKPVEGAQCRLRPDKLKYPSGRFPGFRADVQNAGKQVLWLTGAGELWEVEVDGTWYAPPPPKGISARLFWFGPGSQRYGVRIVLGEYWRSKDGGEAMKLPPGRHSVLAACVLAPERDGSGKAVRAISEPVAIEIGPEK